MDLPTSATPRTKSADTLSIQPDSIRISTTSAAGEFARHLADSSRQSDPARREDRQAERRERSSPATDHSQRDNEVRERETSTREANPRQTTTDDKGEVALETANADESLSTIESEVPATADHVQDSQPATAIESETNSTADAASTETSNEDTPVDLGTAPADIVAEPADAAPHALEAGAKPAEAGASPEESASTPASIQSADSTQTKPDAAATGKNEAQSTLPRAATPGDAPRPQMILPQQPTDTTAAGSPPDTESTALAATDSGTAKPVKGLGQEVAEMLADKKSDARQTAAAASSAPPVPTPSQTPRGGAATQQTVNIAPIETQPAPRGGELPSGTQQTPATATVRIGTLPGQSQPTQVPAMAIALQISRNLQKGINRFEIRLDPPEMGRIDVRMEVRRDGHVMAHLTVEKPETLELLQRDARALQQALNNAGLEADENSLNFSLHDQNANEDRGDIAGTIRADDDTDDADATTTPVYNVNLSAIGGIDIRV